MRSGESKASACNSYGSGHDGRAPDGTASIAQPLIRPLYDSRSAIELVDLIGDPAADADGYARVQQSWASLGQAGWRLRPHLRVRVDRSPRQLAEEWNGSPDGVLWAGRGTLRQRIGTRTPVPGVYAAGAHTVPGAGIAQVTLSAALAVQAIAEDLGGELGGEVGGEPPEDAV